MKPMRVRILVLGAWLAVLFGCLLVILQTRFVADLSAFLPQAPNARQQMLVEQLRDGIIARLIMVGIEGGNTAERVRLSKALAAGLRKDGKLFVGVQNGAAEVLARDQSYFFNNRYLLSDQVRPERFTAQGLHAAIGASIEALSGTTGLMLKRLLPRDPTAETVNLLDRFAGESQPRSVGGVWASRDAQRALLLVQTRAEGSDLDGQAEAISTIRQVFGSLSPHAGAHLVMSGTGVFSVSSRHTIETEVRRLAIAGTLLVVCLLLLVYRSLRLLILGLLPVASGALVGIAAVSLGFGQVHGLTLGFGTTLIGEAVDYSIYLFIQRADGRPLADFWRIIRLGVMTSIVGFAALLCSGFPGLAQLGLYSISGLVAASLVTRFVLPELIPAQLQIRDLGGPGRLLTRWAAGAARLRPLLFICLVASAGWLWHQGGDIWNRQLSSLSPVSRADQQLDAELRADMGAPDMRYIVAFTADNRELALQRAEQLGKVLQNLVRQRILGSFSSPAFVLPSDAAQKRRQAALPDRQSLQSALDKAVEGLPVRAGRLGGFVDDVEQARSRPLLTRADLDGTSSSMLVDSLLVPRAHDYLVLMPLRASGAGSEGDQIDIGVVERELVASRVPGATVIDLLKETTDLYAGYLHEAILLAVWGGIAIIFLLLLSLRSVMRTVRVVLPLLGAILCVAALHVLGTHQMTILHLVGLLLVAAVGSNYALFFDNAAQVTVETQRRQTMVSLVVANCTTVISFGLLGFSQVPILSAIGSTVGPGALLALIFSAILARRGNVNG